MRTARSSDRVALAGSVKADDIGLARRDFDSGFRCRNIGVEISDRCCCLFFQPCRCAQFGCKFLPGKGAVIDENGRRDLLEGGKLVLRRACAACRHDDEIGFGDIDRFQIDLAGRPGIFDLLLFGHLFPLGEELAVGGRAARNNRSPDRQKRAGQRHRGRENAFWLGRYFGLAAIYIGKAARPCLGGGGLRPE
ncbi:hypothetical protein D3C80_1449440 [compost metagenome]